MDQIDNDIDADLSNNDKPIRLKKLVNLNQLQHGVNYEVSDLEYDDDSTTTITTNDNNGHDNYNRSNNNTYNYTNTYFDGEDLFRNINSECTMTPGDDDDTNNSNDNIDPNLSPFERLALSMEPLTEDRQILKRVLRVGVGELMPEGALYRVHYNAYLEYSGEPYDSTRLRKKVCQLRLGVSAIPGWDISLMTMRKDELSKFLVSHEYAYGKMGCPPRIPPEATLLFEIELLSWVDYAAADSYNILTSEEKKLRSFQELLEVVHGERALGNDFFKSKNYQRALRNYSKAIHLLESIDLMNEQEEITWKKEMVRLRLNMAFVNLKLANSRTAIRYCKDVQDYDKNNVKAVYRIGQAYKQLGEFDKAKECFLRAVHLAPKNADIRHELEELENDAKIHLERKKKICQKIFKTESFPKRDTNALLSSLAVPEDFISEIKISFEAFLQDDSVQHLDLPPVLRENERLAVKYLAEEHDLIVTLPDFRKQKSVKVSKKHLFM